jgi:hypothetical protein
VLCNRGCVVSACDEPLVSEDVLYHKALTINFELSYVPRLKPLVKEIYNFHSANYEDINKELRDIDWGTYFCNISCEASVEKLYNLLNHLIDKYVPRRRLRSLSKSPAWYNKSLKKILKEKCKLHRRWKLYGNPLDYDSFKILRKRAEKMEQKCYREFISFTEFNIKNNPKYFWTYIKSIFSSNGLPQTMVYKDIVTSNGENICNLFNSHFHSVFEVYSRSSSDTDNLAAPTNPLIDINSIEISEEIVTRYLKSVNVNKGAGPDGIHPLFIKNCYASLTAPITIIYKKSIKECCVPAIWKKAWITPVPKGPASRNIEKYRPISKLCQFSKLLEKIVTDQLAAVVRHHIIPNQHGFYRGRSVDTNLLTFTNDILLAMDDGFSVDAVYTDFSKAFDKICHYTLLCKLWELGIHGDLFRWIKSYVENRTQSVVVSGFTSQSKYISSGVPQGSHLGPLLFTLYINDIVKCISNSYVLLYADDAKIYKVIRNSSDCELLQNDLCNFESFCRANNLFLNIDKCNAITFSRKKTSSYFNYKLCNQDLVRVNEIRDLGVVMDDKLSFIPHIDSILAKSFKQLGMILRIGKPFRNTLTLKILYNSYVRSRLEFACAVWKPHYSIHIDRIERLQKKFQKALDFKCGIEYKDYVESLNRHKMQSLECRRDCVDSVLLYKIMNSHIDAPSLLKDICIRVPGNKERRCRLRYKHLFSIPCSRTNYSKNMFIKRACTLYNENSIVKNLDIFNCTISSIKKIFKTSL